MAARKSTRASSADVQAIEEIKTGGMNLDDGIVVSTFLLLAIAVTLVVMALGTYPATT